MATKVNLISAVNTFLTAIITQLKVRNAQLEVINEIYPTPATDNSTTETYTTQLSPYITYSIKIVKTGINIRINGDYTHVNSSALPANSVVFELKDTEYDGINDSVFYVGNNCVLRNGRLFTDSPLGTSQSKNFSITYTAKD